MRDMIIRTFKTPILTVQNIFQSICSHLICSYFFIHNVVLTFLSLFYLQYISRANDTHSHLGLLAQSSIGSDMILFLFLCPLLGALLDSAVTNQTRLQHSKVPF